MEKSIAGIVTNYELTKQCVETNFYGAKRMSEAFIPLLHLSNSPRIVNVASFLGKLKVNKLLISLVQFCCGNMIRLRAIDPYGLILFLTRA